MSKEPEPHPDPASSPWERCRQIQGDLKIAAKLRSKAATALGPLTKPAVWDDLEKAEKTLSKVEKKLRAEDWQAIGLEKLLPDLRAWCSERRRRAKQEFFGRLVEKAREEGVEVALLSREEPVTLRVTPFEVQLDLEKGVAHFLFAKDELATCRLDENDVLNQRAKLMDELEKGFDPQGFFARCLAAWRAARAARRIEGERVEILDILPYLALEAQPKRFKETPSVKNYRGYSRGRFAYEVHLLRRARGFLQDGVRLNLGVATGTSASKKKRVIYFEDERGNGEYKLTVFFTRDERAEQS